MDTVANPAQRLVGGAERACLTLAADSNLCALSEVQDQPRVVIRRCYQLDDTALDDLVEILHRLLLDDGGEPPVMPPLCPSATCFQGHVERGMS